MSLFIFYLCLVFLSTRVAGSPEAVAKCSAKHQNAQQAWNDCCPGANNQESTIPGKAYNYTYRCDTAIVVKTQQYFTDPNECAQLCSSNPNCIATYWEREPQEACRFVELIPGPGRYIAMLPSNKPDEDKCNREKEALKKKCQQEKKDAVDEEKRKCQGEKKGAVEDEQKKCKKRTDDAVDEEKKKCQREKKSAEDAHKKKCQREKKTAVDHEKGQCKRQKDHAVKQEKAKCQRRINELKRGQHQDTSNVKCPASNNQQVTVGHKRFHALCDQTFHGSQNLIDGVYSYRDCVARCSADANCIGATWESPRSRCWKFYTISRQTPAPGYHSVRRL